MAKLSSQPVIKVLIKKFENKFKITKESKNKFYFDGAYYSPDLVLYDKKRGRLKAIIEVEQGTRKHVIGGIITADYCMDSIKAKPVFCVLALTKQDLKDYKKRQKMINKYIRHIKRVVIGDLKAIIKTLCHI